MCRAIASLGCFSLLIGGFWKQLPSKEKGVDAPATEVRAVLEVGMVWELARRLILISHLMPCVQIVGLKEINLKEQSQVCAAIGCVA